MFREKRQRKQTEENGQGSCQPRTSSPGRDTEEIKYINAYQLETQTQTQTKAQTEETNKTQPHQTLHSRLRKRGSPISGAIQPRYEDKDKDNGCDTQQRRKERQQSNQIK